MPKPGEKIDLFDVEQRINAMREYEVLKMDVVASGELNEIQLVYGEDTLYPEKSKRYRLSAGRYADFVLAENDALKKMVKSGDTVFTVIGTVTAYFRGKLPFWKLWIRERSKNGQTGCNHYNPEGRSCSMKYMICHFYTPTYSNMAARLSV